MLCWSIVRNCTTRCGRDQAHPAGQDRVSPVPFEDAFRGCEVPAPGCVNYDVLPCRARSGPTVPDIDPPFGRRTRQQSGSGSPSRHR